MPNLLSSTRIPTFRLRSPAAALADEDGSITVMGLIFFGIMVIFAGVALDMVRSERARIETQATLDRATLAAAPLDEERDAREVVESYLRAADIDLATVRIQSYDEPRSTRVTVDGNASIDSFFMDLFGYDVVDASVRSQAREEKWDMEVSLVLDISGSMSSDGRHAAMQAAAKDFTRTILTNAQDEGVLSTISIVPYRGTVNLGSKVASWFPLSGEHTWSRCVVFSAGDYEEVGIRQGTTLERVMHIDRDESSRNWDGVISNPICPSNDLNAILPWARDADAIDTYIDALEPKYGTAINLGAKWGAALLDPSFQPYAADMVTANELPAAYDGMPFAYGGNVQKVLVIMTDGANDEQRDVFPERKNGPSGVFVYRPDLSVPEATGASATGLHGLDDIDGSSNWSASWHATRARGQDWWANGGTYNGYAWWEDLDRRNWDSFEDPGSDGGSEVYTEYSYWSEARQQFWVKRAPDPGQRSYSGNDNGNNSRFRNGTFDPRREKTGGTWQDEPAGGTDAIELTFAEHWNSVPILTMRNNGGSTKFWFEDRHAYDGLDDDSVDWYGAYEGQSTMRDELNGYLFDICDAAREAGILVYTIAFRASDNGKSDMQTCAGDRSGRALIAEDNAAIATAFDSILASIDKLKLTQ